MAVYDIQFEILLGSRSKHYPPLTSVKVGRSQEPMISGCQAAKQFLWLGCTVWLVASGGPDDETAGLIRVLSLIHI